MQNIKYLAIASLIFLLSGCLVPSIHPLFTPEDAISKPELIGVWVNDREKWIIDENGNNLTIIQDQSDSTKVEIDTAFFTLVIGRIGNKEFIDLIPKPIGNGEGKVDFFKSLVIPHHSFGIIDINDSSIFLGFFSSNWIKDQIEKKKKIGIKYEKYDNDNFIITSPTKELQAFARKNVNNSEVFSDSTTLTKAIIDK